MPSPSADSSSPKICLHPLLHRADLELPYVTPSRAELRRRLERVIQTDVELDAFLLNYFRDTYHLIADGMSRMRKENLLLERNSEQEIDFFLSLQAANQPTRISQSLGSYQQPAVAAPPRRERARRRFLRRLRRWYSYLMVAFFVHLAHRVGEFFQQLLASLCRLLSLIQVQRLPSQLGLRSIVALAVVASFSAFPQPDAEAPVPAVARRQGGGATSESLPACPQPDEGELAARTGSAPAPVVPAPQRHARTLVDLGASLRMERGTVHSLVDSSSRPRDQSVPAQVPRPKLRAAHPLMEPSSEARAPATRAPGPSPVDLKLKEQGLATPNAPRNRTTLLKKLEPSGGPAAWFDKTSTDF